MSVCFKNCSLAVTEGDMPLDQATYDSTRDVIFGVRGGYIQEFNATTGAPTANRVRFLAENLGDSSIVYDAGTDRLFITVWYDPIGSVPSPRNGIYKINPATLAQEAFDDMSTWDTFSVAFNQGPFGQVNVDSLRRRLIISAGVIYGFFTPYVFKYTTGTAVGIFQSGALFTSTGWSAPSVSGTELWMPGPDSGRIQTFDLTTTEMQPGPQILLPGVDAWDIAVNTTNGRAYCSTRSAVIKRISALHAVLTDLTLPNPLAKPFCIRYNAAENKIYCPDETTNTVFVIDGATEAITAQTGGFDSPFDMVFTPTKKFAVQHGAVGIKEVL